MRSCGNGLRLGEIGYIQLAGDHSEGGAALIVALRRAFGARIKAGGCAAWRESADVERVEHSPALGAFGYLAASNAKSEFRVLGQDTGSFSQPPRLWRTSDHQET